MKSVEVLSALFVTIALVHTLVQENYGILALQVAIVVLPIIAGIYRDKPVGRLLFHEFGPRTKTGMRLSEYSYQMASFSLRCGLLVVFLWSLGLNFGEDAQENGFYIGTFAFTLPLFFAMALSALIYQSLRFLYIKLTGRDRIWSDADSER